MPQTASRIALVTGANKGIGFEIARQLGTDGTRILVGARDADRGQAAVASLRNDGIDARYVQIDLIEAATIQAAAADVEAQEGLLDILINNAGISDQADGAPSVANLEAVERVLRTNFLGALTVTQGLLPLLRKSSAGRIVNVSSGLGSLDYNVDPNSEFANVKYLGYSASKAALNMLTVQLAFELRETGIKVNSADPGFTATDLNQHRGHQTVEQGAAEAVRLALLPEDGPTGGFFSSTGRLPW